MLEVKSISRHYGALKAVDNVSFAIQPGEIVGLLGHNGAGKTTIMKMLSGYLEPDFGTIHFQNQTISLDDKKLQRALGYLPENIPVYPELSVASYLQYAAELKGLKGAGQRQAVRAAVEATDLNSRFLSPISTLSRGMKQRVGVAQAILGKPSLLILDEPTNGLDPAQTEQMRQLIKSISENATVILSTHIMQEVEAVCDRALIVRQGQLAVDTSLAALQDTQRIRLRSTASLSSVEEALKGLAWIQSIIQLDGNHSDGSKLSFRIESRNNIASEQAIDQCATQLVEKAIPIFSLHPDRRDLQSLFMNLSSSETSHADTGSVEAQEVDHVA
ncbi:ABC transporter ATP-binding protein [Granulosicoccus sp.]|nr:ABC transporter ATP-binding protein [Granulosicoccus sp.]MDB4223957.1 ABC transporter ATP-binding protein [Granulosicoccus sp.]